MTDGLVAWAGTDADRRRRVAITFGTAGRPWQPDLVLQRYELLYEAGLVPEAPTECRRPEDALAPGRRMLGDHRRVLATGLARLRAKIGYRPVVFGARPQSLGWHGNTLLVRKDIEVVAQRTLILPGLEPRGAVLADLQLHNTGFRVVGLHLGLLGLWRKRQAQAVLDQLEALEQPLPTVIMGDLNEWSVNGGCLANFSRDHHVGWPGPSYPSMRPVFSYDRFIASADVSIDAVGVHGTAMARVASDHLPVWAHLGLNGESLALHEAGATRAG